MKINQTNLFESNTADNAGEISMVSNFDFVLVQGEGFRCIAYQDGNGIWREAFNNLAIPGTIRVLK